MAFLNPVLGNTRQDILTPEEQATGFRANPSVIGQNYEVDRDNFKGINLDLAISGGVGALEDARAKSQSNLQLFGKGAGNLLGTALFEVAKLPGYAIGGAKAAFTGDIEDMINGQYLQGVKAVQEATQEKWFEVYTPKEVSEGNVLKQLANPYFWASEGANGVGFLLSFLVPGQALKAFGLGAKTASGLGKLGKLAEVVADGEKILQGGNGFGRVMLKTLGKSGRALDFGKMAGNIDSTLAVSLNTMFESAAESSELFDDMVAKGSTKEEAALAASQSFKMNLGLLAISNTLVEKYIFGGFGRSLLSPRKLTNEIITGSKEIEKSLLKASVKKLPYAIGAGIAQEGFFEEGLQTSINQVQGGTIGEVLEQYQKNVSSMFSDDPESIDFAKSVVLGGVLGGGMSVGGAVGEAKRENNFLFGTEASNPSAIGKFFGYKSAEASAGAIELLRSGYKALRSDKSELFSFDANGKVTGFTPNAKDKLTEAGNLELMSNWYNDLLVKNQGNVNKTNTEFVEDLKAAGAKPQEAILFRNIVQAPSTLSDAEAIAYVEHLGHKRYLDNFLNMEGGAQLAEAHIDDMVEAMQVRYEGNTGVKMDSRQVEDTRSTLKRELEESTRLHEQIQADHSQARIGFNPIQEGDPDPKKTVERYSAFFNRAKHARLELLRDIEYFKGRLKKMPDAGTASPAQTKEFEALTETVAEMESRYAKMSTKKGLKELWDKWQAGEKAKTTAVGQPTIDPATGQPTPGTAPAPEMTKDQFWGEVEAAGYSIEVNPDGTRSFKDDVNIHVMGKGNRPKIISAIKDGSGKAKISMMDADNPKNVRLFDNLRALMNELGELKIIPRDEIVQRRKERKDEEARQKAIQIENATRQAMIDKLDELNRLDKVIEQQLEGLNKDLSQKLLSLKSIKQISDPSVTEARKLLQDEIKKLQDLISSLQAKRTTMGAQIEVLTEYIAATQDSSLKEILALEEENRRAEGDTMFNEFSNYDLNGLIAATEELDNLLDSYNRELNYYTDVLAVLDEMALRSQVNIEALDKEYTQEFKDKYSYPHPQTGKPVYPPDASAEVNKAAQGKPSARIDKHLDRVSLRTGQPPAELKRQFIKDAGNLQKARAILSHLSKEDQINLSIDKMAEFKGMLLEQIDKIKAKSDSANEAGFVLDAFRRGKAFQSLSAELNRKFRARKRQSFLKNPDKAQVVSQDDGGDNNYTPQRITDEDPFFGHALSSELYGTTGVSIMYTKNGDDLYMPDGENFAPVVNPNPYQQTFFRWIEDADTTKFKVEARVAFYDERDGEMQEAFKGTNPEASRVPGSDVFAVIVDKSGAIVKVNDTPVFTAIRTVDSKFPRNGRPKMNMYSLMSQYIQDGLNLGIPVTREMLNSNKPSQREIPYRARQELASVLAIPMDELNTKTTSEVFALLEKDAIAWGRAKYEEFMSYIRMTYAPNERAVVLPVLGITQGHPVRVLDKNNEILTYNTQEALGLEVSPNGKPKNFRILKANYKGNITVGNKIQGGFQPGVIYVKKHNSNQIIPIINDTVAKEEAQLVLHILAKMAGGKSLQGTAGVDVAADYPQGMTLKVNGQIYGQGNEIKLFPQVKDKFSIINMLMMWGSNSANGTADIFIKDGVLFYGSQSVSLETIARSISLENGLFVIKDGPVMELAEFLVNRRFHISYDMLNAAQVNGGKYYHPTLDKSTGRIRFQEHSSYVEYIMTRTKTDVVPREVLDRFNLPQFAQRNIQFSSPVARVEEKKIIGKEKPISKPNDQPTSTLSQAEIGKRILLAMSPKGEARVNELIQEKGLTKEDLKKLAAQGKTRASEIEKMGIVPKPSSTSPEDLLLYRKKLADHGAMLAILEAVGALGEKKKADPAPASPASTPTAASIPTPPASNQPLPGVDEMIKQYVKGESDAIGDAHVNKLVASGYVAKDILAEVEKTWKSYLVQVINAKLIPKPTSGDAADMTVWNRSNAKAAKFIALMNIAEKATASQPEPTPVPEVTEKKPAESPEELKARLDKMREQARNRGNIQVKGRFGKPKDNDAGLDQRLTSTELLEKLMEDGIIEQNCK